MSPHPRTTRLAAALATFAVATTAACVVASPAAAATPPDRLGTGATLAAGSALVSPRGQSRLVMQTDGNLVLYTNGAATWQTGTSGAANRLVEQADGNLVVYTSTDTALWSAQTRGGGAGTLVVQDDGNLVNYLNAGGYDWNTSTTDDVLPSGQTLTSGQTLQSKNRQQSLTMQDDGNLVLYSNGVAVWSTGTRGSTGARAVFQSDGNLVVYSSTDTVLWQAGTRGAGGTSLIAQDDGNLVMYGPSGSVWSSGTADDSLWAPHELDAGSTLVSEGDAVQLVLQTDGNLVVYSDGRALWNSGTRGSGASKLVVQADGNLVLYTASGAAAWSSGTRGSGGDHLVVQGDGNLVLYNSSTGAAVWNAGSTVVVASSAGGPISQAEILSRAQSWINAGVPYSQTNYRTDSNGYYRQDCSGFVSMAWHLRSSLVTQTFNTVSVQINRADLQPGDALLVPSEHIAMFLRWNDSSHTSVVVQEESGAWNGEPAVQDVWSASYAAQYIPIRYVNKTG